MRFLVILASLLIVSCSGCMKKEQGCSNVKPSDEETAILAYAAANNLTVQPHTTGLYYQVVAPGAGAKPNTSSNVMVTYTGKLLNGTQFDQSTTPITFPLNQVIEGWIVGIPLISEGGKIRLLIPSSMAYGCNGFQSIPPNAILYFEVDLIDVQ